MTVMDWLLPGGTLVLLAIAAGAVYAVRFWPADGRRRALARQAQQDYAAARGSAHLAVLRQARGRLQARQAELSAALAAAQARRQALERERRTALVAALEAHLARDCFESDVDGVGPVLAQRILERAFRGRLADLMRASDYIEGIGASRQQAIDQWVRDCQRRQPVLLESRFPGKTEILQRYAAAQAEVSVAVSRLTAGQAALGPQLAQVERAIAALEQVTVHDFEAALAEPDRPQPALESYLRGVFAEWETPPAWFAQLSAREAPQ